MQPDRTVPAPGETLVEVLDRLLDTGIVLDGQIVLSVAGIDLVHVGLRALLASVDTAARLASADAAARFASADAAARFTSADAAARLGPT